VLTVGIGPGCEFVVFVVAELGDFVAGIGEGGHVAVVVVSIYVCAAWPGLLGEPLQGVIDI